MEEADQWPGTAHEGPKKVLELRVHSYYWPGMKRDGQLQLATFPTSDKFHSPSKRQHAKPNPFPTNDRGEIHAIDVFAGKASLPETPRANRYILTMSDLFTKFGVGGPMPEQWVFHALLSQLVLLFVAPRRLLTDQAAYFESGIVQNLCTIWCIEKVRTRPYHPAGNGACERLNQTFMGGLQKMPNEKRLEEWDVELSKDIFAYNTSVHCTTGFTPYFLIFGVAACVLREILVGLPQPERTPASYAFHRYQTLGVS